ncbi:hypothetical protein IM876_09070 [Serratia plymuthica]|uniref:hypothetical protein n=1 Tax=Serratia plymuthica TaxID=82996 RepID=UPI001925E7AD|nr:hypothetical protein [Serratia plymuthica]MBL3522813.1 hypothetical protein [Serratia plymuthica]
MEKLSELSKPVMYVVRTLDGSVASVKNYKYTAPKGFTSEPLYSQEYVSALLAELEAKAQCITGLDRHVKDIEATLIVAADEVADLTKERDEARAKLATPVRLPEGLAQKIKVTGYYEALNEMMDCVRAAGFKCVGDE